MKRPVYRCFTGYSERTTT